MREVAWCDELLTPVTNPHPFFIVPFRSKTCRPSAAHGNGCAAVRDTSTATCGGGVRCTASEKRDPVAERNRRTALQAPAFDKETCRWCLAVECGISYPANEAL